MCVKFLIYLEFVLHETFETLVIHMHKKIKIK